MRAILLLVTGLFTNLLTGQGGVDHHTATELSSPSPADSILMDSPDLEDLTLLRTALPYEGRRRLKTVMLLYNVVDFNLNRHLQLSVGNAAVLGVAFSQRYRTSVRPWLHLGLSNETLAVPIFDYETVVGVAGDLTSLLTIGSQEQFVSFGAGMFYAIGGGIVSNYRVGAATRISPSVHVYGEALAYGGAEDQLTLAPTVNVSLTRRRHRWHFGILSIVLDHDNYLPPPLPYLGYALYY